MSLGFRWIRFAVPFVVLAGEAGAEVIRRGPGQSPLECVDIDSVAVPDAEAIRASVRRYVGREGWDGAPRLVRFSDEVVFGDTVQDRLAWVVSVPSVDVTRWAPDFRGEPDSTKVDVNLVLSAAGDRLVAAFTTPKEQWVLPTYTDTSSVEANVRACCPEFAPIETEAFELTIPEVLGIAWSHDDWSPTDLGQIIVRPRRALCTWPPRERDGALVPNETSADYWIVQELGYVMSQFERASDEYPTGFIRLISDAEPEVTIGYARP